MTAGETRVQARVDTLLFDFYGTIGIYSDLATGERKICEQLFSYVRRHNSGLDFAEFTAAWKETASHPLPLVELTEETIFLTKIARLCRRFAVEPGSDVVRRLGEECLTTWHEFISFPDDLSSLLSRLAGRYTLGLVSNFDHPTYLRGLLRRRGLEPFFQTVVISGEIGVCKPDPEIFRLALAAVGAAPGRTAFVGDSLQEDIAGARQAGCLPILVDREDRFPEFPGLRIRSLAELSELDLGPPAGGLFA